MHRCRPGEAGADERGCVLQPADTLCGTARVCDEALDRCTDADCSNPDRDGDGRDAIACGGPDCDDDDEDRYAGNPEVCDAAGHDEDCLPNTFAGATDGDIDLDGEISAACCNGDACGTDCDDADPSVNTGAAEQCNGVDDDCSGTADDAPGDTPLCPGGTCSAGRCSFTAWDRIFGGAGNDYASAICSDSAGNLYVTGPINGGVDFGSGPVMAPALVSYTASGMLRWVVVNDADTRLNNADVACDAERDRVYLLSSGSARFGSVVAGPGAFVAAIDTSGTVRSVAAVPGLSGGVYRRGSVDARAGLVVVASGFSGSFDPGDGSPRTAAGTTDGYVYALDATGTFAWMRTFGAVGARTELRAISIDSSGNIYVTGDYDGAVDFGDGPRAAPGVAAIPVISLDSTGATRWARVFGSAGFDSAEAIDAGPDTLFFTGTLGGPVDFGGGPAGDTGQGYVAALGHDGSHRWERTFRDLAPSSTATPLDVEALAGGGVWVVGAFSGTIDFGGGGLSSHEESSFFTEDIFMVLYGEDRTHVRDRALGEGNRQAARAITIGSGGSTTIAGEFAGSITFASGRRTSPVGTWGFVARTAD